MQTTDFSHKNGSSKRNGPISRKSPHGKRDEPSIFHLVEYEITFEPLELSGTPFDKKDQSQFEKAHRCLRGNEASKAVPIYELLISKYGDKPELKNNLAMALRLSGRENDADILVEKTAEEFPEYLFGKVALAELFLRRKQVDRVSEIFNNKYCLKLLYPKRSVFHISEVLCFFSVMTFYFLESDKIETAIVYLEAMEEIAPDAPVTIDCRNTFEKKTMSITFKNFAEAFAKRRISKQPKKKQGGRIIDGNNNV